MKRRGHALRRRYGHAESRSLFSLITPGARVTIVDRFGHESSGKAVMLGPAGWVLNMGGRHGTPAIASDDNITNVKPPKKPAGAGAMMIAYGYGGPRRYGHSRGDSRLDFDDYTPPRGQAVDYSAPTRALINRYRDLVARQRKLPASTQWTMGPALKEARAKALIAIEEESFGLRGSR